MTAKDIKNGDDIERFILGCLNDFETGLSTKSETLIALGEMVVHIYETTKGEDKLTS